MIIATGSAQKGWAEYVFSKEKQQNENAILIDGDLLRNKKIIKNSNYSKNYVRYVISPEGELDPNILKNIYKDWKDLFMRNYPERDITAVIHQKPNNSHIHICTPNHDPITGNRKDVYYEKIDRERMNNIKNYIIKKYNLLPDFNMTNIEKLGIKEEKIKIPKRKRSLENLQIKLKKEINFLIKINSIKTEKGIAIFLEHKGLKITKKGYDYRANFHYITIEDKDGKKTRIKGDIFKKGMDFRNNKNNEKEQTLEELKAICERDILLNKKHIEKHTSKSEKKKIEEYKEELKKIEKTPKKTPNKDNKRKKIMTKADTFKTEINLIDYVAQYGYKIRDDKNNTYDTTVENQYGEKLIIALNNKDEFIYFSTNGNHKGSIIDFEMEMAKRAKKPKKFWQILSKLEKYHQNPKLIETTTFKPQKQPMEIF